MAISKKTSKKKAIAKKTNNKIKVMGEVVDAPRFQSSVQLEKDERILAVLTIQVPVIAEFKAPKPKRKNNQPKHCCKKVKRKPALKILDIKSTLEKGRLKTLLVKVRAAHPCGISFVAASIVLSSFASGEERLAKFKVDGKDAEAEMSFSCIEAEASSVVEGTLEIPAKGLAGQEFRVYAIAFDCCGKSADLLSEVIIIF